MGALSSLTAVDLHGHKEYKIHVPKARHCGLRAVRIQPSTLMTTKDIVLAVYTLRFRCPLRAVSKDQRAEYMRQRREEGQCPNLGTHLLIFAAILVAYIIWR